MCLPGCSASRVRYGERRSLSSLVTSDDVDLEDKLCVSAREPLGGGQIHGDTTVVSTRDPASARRWASVKVLLCDDLVSRIEDLHISVFQAAPTSRACLKSPKPALKFRRPQKHWEAAQDRDLRKRQ